MTNTNLLKKLHEIQSATRSLAKDGDGNKNQYHFVTGNKILGHIRGLMDSKGIILNTEVTSHKETRIDYKVSSGEKSAMFIMLDLLFTWIDTETGETLTSTFAASGMNDWDKGLGSALTYGERYYLLKFFHIATDQDDIDALDRELVINWDEGSLRAMEKEAKGILAKDGRSTRDAWVSVYKPDEEVLKAFDEEVRRLKELNRISA